MGIDLAFVEPGRPMGDAMSLAGYLTAGATPVWLLGSFAVLSLLYRADTSATPATIVAEASAELASWRRPAPRSNRQAPRR